MPKRMLFIGESYPITLGAPEVIMHMHMVGQTHLVELREAGAYIDGRTHVTHGESGIRTDYRGTFWVSSEDQPHVRKCATIGCDGGASRWISYPMQGGVFDGIPAHDGVCKPCADGYLSRPALGAAEIPREDWPSDLDNVYVYATGPRDDGMRFAVGVMPNGGPVNGSFALFREPSDARMFAESLAQHAEVMAYVLPSADEQ